MPSVKPNMPEEGFRRQVYGFNKDDVLAYVSALANEAQQQQQQYEEQITQLKAQLDKLRQDQQNARACVEKLQSDLLTQTSRAEKAEGDLAAANKKLSEYQDELKLSESHATNYRDRYQQSQKTLLEWQNRCRELEQQLQDARAAAAAAAIGQMAQDPPEDEEPSYFSAPPEDAAAAVDTQIPQQPEPEPAPAELTQPDPVPPAPRQEEAPAQAEQSSREGTPDPEVRPDPDPSWWATEHSATVRARKILADARIYAQSTERRMRQEAEEQKARMAGNARDLAAGVQLLRDRLSRVDEKLSAASIDLENATAAIYEALDHTEADLQALGAKLDAFANGTPELDTPRPAPAAKPARAPKAAPAARTPVVPAPQPPVREPAALAAQPRSGAAPQRVRPVVKAKQTKPAAPVRRLRSSRRAVDQTLQDALGRLDGDTPQ